MLEPSAGLIVNRQSDHLFPGPLGETMLEVRPDAALVALGQWLHDQNYRFTPPTPETHARVNARASNQQAHSLRDIFGWSRPFRAETLPTRALELLRMASAIEHSGGLLRSTLRYSTIGDRLFVHSAYPTHARDAVFFGPDTYRFTAFVEQVLRAPWPSAVRRVVDIGCGSGAGAIMASAWLDPRALREVLLTDINPRALQLAAANVAINDMLHARYALADALAETSGLFDLIIANPPYMIDTRHRAYCDGGGDWGVEVALHFLREALSHLAPGGRLALYTGTPIINGRDLFELASLPVLQAAQVKFRYGEIDPDVFGEDLVLPEYAAVDRVAVVGLVAHRPGSVR